MDSTKLKNDVVFPLSTVKPVKRPKLKLDTESFLQGSEDEEKVSKSNNGDLSPPVLEPMCTSPKPKSFISDILSPPTLIPSKKSYFGPKMLNEIEHKRPSEFENKPLFRLSSDVSNCIFNIYLELGRGYSQHLENIPHLTTCLFAWVNVISYDICTIRTEIKLLTFERTFGNRILKILVAFAESNVTSYLSYTFKCKLGFIE